MAQTGGDRRILAKLKACYRLTDSEADIALRLAEGRSLKEIAKQRGASLHTVRNQVKAAFNKTATRRQSELVALVLRLRFSGRA